MKSKKIRQNVVRKSGFAALVVLAASVFAACSDRGSSDFATSSDSSGSPEIDDVFAEPYRELWDAWSGDLEGMIERRIIRVVTAYGGYLYYFDEGEPRGATWELANRYEAALNDELGRRNVRVFVVVIPLGRDQLIPALLDGRADVIAADLTITDLRSKELAFTRPLLKNINEVIVTGPSTPAIETLDDLAGRDIHVRRASSYFEHLEAFAKSMDDSGLSPPNIVAIDELLESEDVLDMLNAGMIELTVMDDYKAEFWSAAFPDITVRKDLRINEGGSIAWVTRQESPELLQSLNAFLRKNGRGTLIGNDTYNRYLADSKDLRCSKTMSNDVRLKELAETFMHFGEQFSFDWLQLAAQAFQESKFDQSRTSGAGAVGIMQIKPSTAADPNVGVEDISTVDGNVHAGAKYLRFIADRYFDEAEIDPLNRWLLSLAAYNAGPARVIQLRQEASELGYNPNLWFDNVEIIAAKRIGSETVTYVSNIFKYYSGYQMAFAKAAEGERRFSESLDACYR